VTASAQVRSDAVSMTACGFLTSADISHQVACTRASAVRDEEARRFPRQQVAETGVAARSDVGAMVGDGAATGLSDWLWALDHARYAPKSSRGAASRLVRAE